METDRKQQILREIDQAMHIRGRAGFGLDAEKWTSVKDALPRVGHSVLGYVEGSRLGTLQEEPDEYDVVYIKREFSRDDGPFWVHRGDDHIGLNVTYWRELPNGPSTERGDQSIPDNEMISPSPEEKK